MIPSLLPNVGAPDLVACLRVWKDEEAAYLASARQVFAIEHAATVASARAGLFHILRAHDVIGKDVLVTAYTCCVVTEAIVQSGNRPVVVDVEENSINADITEELIDKHRTNLGAVILTSLFGLADFLVPRARRGQGFLIILDAALAPGAIPAAPHEAFDYIYSSGGVRKPLTSLGGGTVLTAHATNVATLSQYLARTIKPRSAYDRAAGMGWAMAYFLAFRPGAYELSSLLRRKTTLLDGFFSERSHELGAQNPQYLHDMRGYQKRVGTLQLAGLAETQQRRREIGNLYRQLLAPRFPDAAGYWRADVPYSHFPFLHPRRDALQQHLLEAGIDVERYFDYAIPEIEAYQMADDCPRAKRLGREMLNLPMHHKLTDADIHRIVGEIVRFDPGVSHG